MANIIDSPTLWPMLRFIDDAMAWSDREKRNSLRILYLFLISFVLEYIRRNNLEYCTNLKQACEIVESFAEYGDFESLQDEAKFRQHVEENIPGMDPDTTLWLDEFSQDALLALEAFFRFFEEDAIDLDRFFDISINTFAKFCEIIAQEYVKGDDLYVLLNMLSIASRNFDSNVKSEILEITKQVYG